MRKFFTWLFILAKRQLKNPFLLIMLALIPAICLTSEFMNSSQSDSSYTAGMYVDGDDEISKELAGNLLKRESTFEFVIYNDPDKMIRDVKNSTLICGYIFPDDLKDKTTDKDCTDSIIVYSPTSSSVQGAINEVVYSELIRIQGRYIITDYVDSKEVFNDSDVDYSEELLESYNNYLNSDVTFHIAFSKYGIDGIKEIEDTNIHVAFPIRGILAILVYLAGMFGSVMWMRDNEKGIFATLTVGYQRLCRILYAFIPVILFGIMMLVSLAASGQLMSIANELGAMLVLIVLSAAFAVLMTYITRTSHTYAACIPILLLCALLFCPVFFNAGNYVPAARFVEKLFVPYYYLELFV